MSHINILPVGRYGIAGFISLLTILLMFMALFNAINTPRSPAVIVIPAPKTFFTRLEPQQPMTPIEIIKPVFISSGHLPVQHPPTITSGEKPTRVPPPDRTGMVSDPVTRTDTAVVLEGDVSAIVKIPPLYPVVAEAQGIQGYVVVQYSVTAAGTTRDIRIIDARPGSVFNQTALDAVAKFRFKPRVRNGQLVETRGLQDRFVFELK